MSNTVTRAMLEAVADSAPQQSGNRTEGSAVFTHNAATGSGIDLERVLMDSGIDYVKKARNYGTAFDLPQCLTSSEHDTGASFIQFDSGAVAYRCLHDSCSGKSWEDVKPALKLPPKPTITVNGQEAGAYRPQGKTAEPAAVGLKLRKASEIEPREIEWLWPLWLPYGMLTLFAGYGGSGKSTSALAIAAAATVGGTLPDGKTAPLTNVLILAAEDSPEHTLIPRLIWLGADLERVHIVDGVVRDNEEPGWLQLREHMPLLEATVRAHNVGLVIVDPISSYIGDANSDKESDVRSALMPVVQMAERTGAAVLAIRHVSKGGDSHRAASRILGSTAWHDVPRLAWMLADAPDEHQPEKNEDGTRDVKRVLGVVKSNLATKPPARWGVQPADGPFRWLPDPSPVTVDECFRSAAEGSSKTSDAEQWLKERLAGGSQSSKSIEKGAKDAGISYAALRRARASLNVKARKESSGEWWLSLPPKLAEPETEGVQSKAFKSPTHERLERLEPLPKALTMNALNAFPQPRGKSGDSPFTPESHEPGQESKAFKTLTLKENERLPNEESEPEEWSLDI